mgnify:CR=1 FL=1
MFNVGDLVRFRDSGVFKKSREHPDKTIGLILSIERDAFLTYEGDYDDNIVVRWIPLGTEERLPEFLLEKVTENA